MTEQVWILATIFYQQVSQKMIWPIIFVVFHLPCNLVFLHWGRQQKNRNKKSNWDIIFVEEEVGDFPHRPRIWSGRSAMVIFSPTVHLLGMGGEGERIMRSTTSTGPVPPATTIRSTEVVFLLKIVCEGGSIFAGTITDTGVGAMSNWSYHLCERYGPCQCSVG